MKKNTNLKEKAYTQVLDLALLLAMLPWTVFLPFLILIFFVWKGWRLFLIKNKLSAGFVPFLSLCPQVLA